ncbi:hypothetical protein SAMN05216488_2303 [Microbacterium sp. LKL04]|uniref:hypothetical protein n=1 Tax=Microbacterium sp. LKL04 TaxID=912630 RepID=UPI000875D3E5|nr:hypothetical protein [Microbacterium sp. LKL04]SCY56121.1 hypothetical protein SAMN05216488_2303 [Microbacterium sp. LKL04]
MHWWLTKLLEASMRFIWPIAGILAGCALIWMTIVFASKDGGLWILLIPALTVLLVSMFALIWSNTPRARKQWQQYEMPDDPDS